MGVWWLGLLSIYYMAVVEWHRETGSKELHNPCVLYREITMLAGYTDVLGKASHKAGCCCVLTIAIAQTLQQYCIRGTQATYTWRTQRDGGADILLYTPHAGFLQNTCFQLWLGFQHWLALWITRCMLTSLSNHLLYFNEHTVSPSKKSLFMSKSNITVTITLFCCSEHKSSI